MELDKEPGVDRSQLQDIIRKQTQSENKALVNEINKLHKKLAQLESSKKAPRGPSSPGASTQKQVTRATKKHAPKTQLRNQKSGTGPSNPRKNGRAGGSDNASRRNSGNKTGNAGSNRTQRNGTRSKTRKSK
jgi:hypothetical protein